MEHSNRLLEMYKWESYYISSRVIPILTVIPYMDGQFNFFQDIEIIVFIIVHIQSM